MLDPSLTCSMWAQLSVIATPHDSPAPHNNGSLNRRRRAGKLDMVCCICESVGGMSINYQGFTATCRAVWADELTRLASVEHTRSCCQDLPA